MVPCGGWDGAASIVDRLLIPLSDQISDTITRLRFTARPNEDGPENSLRRKNMYMCEKMFSNPLANRLASWTLTGVAGIYFMLLSTVPVLADTRDPESQNKPNIIPILGTTLDYQSNPIGVVAQIEIEFHERQDRDGLYIQFRTRPGRFSSRAQHAVREAISRTAQAAGVETNSWTVTLTVPYKGITIYGDSLSAMVGLSVVAISKGDPLHSDRAITGTITQDGHIGTVGGVPYKIYAAYALDFEKVLIPEERHIEDGDWQTPFMMQVSPVQTVQKAYLGLTDRPL